MPCRLRYASESDADAPLFSADAMLSDAFRHIDYVDAF